MPKGIYITLLDIQIIRGCSQTRASNIKHLYLDTLGLKRNELTIQEFCEMEEITEQLFDKSIKKHFEKLKQHA